MATNATKYAQSYLVSHQQRYANFREEAYKELISQYGNEVEYRKLLIEREKALLSALERLQRETGRQTGDSDIDLNKMRLELQAISSQIGAQESGAQRRITILKEQSNKLAVPDAAQRKLQERGDVLATQGGLTGNSSALKQLMLQSVSDVASSVSAGSTNAAGTAQALLKQLTSSKEWNRLNAQEAAEVTNSINLAFGLDAVNIGGVSGTSLLTVPQDILLQRETDAILQSEGAAFGVGKLQNFINRLSGAKTEAEAKAAFDQIYADPQIREIFVKIERGDDPNDINKFSEEERRLYNGLKNVAEKATLPRDIEKYFDPQWIEKRSQVLEQYDELTGVQKELKERGKQPLELPSEEAVRERAREKYSPEAAIRLRKEFERDSYAGDNVKLSHYDAIQRANSFPIKEDDAAYKAAQQLIETQKIGNASMTDRRQGTIDAAVAYAGDDKNARDKFLTAYHQIQLGERKNKFEPVAEPPRMQAELPVAPPPTLGGFKTDEEGFATTSRGEKMFVPPPFREGAGALPEGGKVAELGKRLSSLPSMADLFKQTF